MASGKACGAVLAAWLVLGSGGLAHAQQGALPGGWSDEVGYQNLGPLSDAMTTANYIAQGYAAFDSFGGGYASGPNAGLARPSIPLIPPPNVTPPITPGTVNALVPLARTIERKTGTRRRR